MQMTDEKIGQVAARAIADANNEMTFATIIGGAIRKALALAGAEPAKPEADCETCRFCGTSAADPPCCDCATTKAMKWEPKPAEPETPDRTGQWWKDLKSDAMIKIISLPNVDGWHSVSVERGTLLYVSVAERGLKEYWLRIPAPPADAPADLKGWQCRKPVKPEPWYNTEGQLITLSNWHFPAEDPVVDQRRWIPPQTAKKAWPEGPFEAKLVVKDEPHGWHVVSDHGWHVCNKCSQTEAEAIALALNLNMLPECVAWMKDHARKLAALDINHSCDDRISREARDALLAKLAAAGFDLTTKEN